MESTANMYTQYIHQTICGAWQKLCNQIECQVIYQTSWVCGDEIRFYLKDAEGKCIISSSCKIEDTEGPDGGRGYYQVTPSWRSFQKNLEEYLLTRMLGVQQAFQFTGLQELCRAWKRDKSFQLPKLLHKLAVEHALPQVHIPMCTNTQLILHRLA